MSFTDAIKSQLTGGFGTDISTAEILISLGITLIIALYLFIVYRLITENAFYSKNFNISMVAMAIVTAGIILAMQSSLVISLGMVGALSIVRFRTAIKEPMDLLFLFWSIGTGIICGAGVYKVAILLAVIVTIVVVFLKYTPETRGNQMVFVGVDNTEGAAGSEEIEAVLKNNTSYRKIKSRNLSAASTDYVYEVRTKDDAKLAAELKTLKGVSTLSVVSHDGEFRG